MKASTSYWLFEKEQQDVRAYLNVAAGIGKTDDHFKLKTSDRAPNRLHCREVVELATKLGEKGMKPILARYGCTASQLLMAATGRPRKNARASDKGLAETKSGTILNDLRKANKRQIKASTYKAGRIKHPEKAETLAEEIKRIQEFADVQQVIIDKREKAAEARKKAPATRKKVVKKTA